MVFAPGKGGDEVVDALPARPSQEQARAYGGLVASGAALSEAVLAAIFDLYLRIAPTFREAYGAGSADAVERVPELERPEELRRVIRLEAILLLGITREGSAYVGLSFDCSWDPEHGLGVLLHGDRIVEVGEQETAFLGWIARADAERGA